MPNDENPYAAPTSQDTSEPNPDWPLPQIWVDGKFLVVADGVTLPQRCVFTNEPVNEPRLVQTLKWAPTFKLVITERKARVTYAVNRRRQKKQRLKRYTVSSLQAVGALLLYLATNNLLPSIFIAVSGIPVFLEKPVFLVAKKCKNDRFWLRGCGPEFLASCVDEFGTGQRPAE